MVVIWKPTLSDMIHNMIAADAAEFIEDGREDSK
jgi:hypothetical protein